MDNTNPQLQGNIYMYLGLVFCSTGPLLNMELADSTLTGESNLALPNYL